LIAARKRSAFPGSPECRPLTSSSPRSRRRHSVSTRCRQGSGGDHPVGIQATKRIWTIALPPCQRKLRRSSRGGIGVSSRVRPRGRSRTRFQLPGRAECHSSLDLPFEEDADPTRFGAACGSRATMSDSAVRARRVCGARRRDQLYVMRLFVRRGGSSGANQRASLCHELLGLPTSGSSPVSTRFWATSRSLMLRC